jgi:hypothetical protein
MRTSCEMAMLLLKEHEKNVRFGVTVLGQLLYMHHEGQARMWQSTKV